MTYTAVNSVKYPLISLTKFKSFKTVGDHAWMEIEGIVSDEVGKDTIVTHSSKEGISFYAGSPNNSRTPIFNGVIETININNMTKVKNLSMKCVSRSTLMDRYPKLRTFQDASTTYKKVADSLKGTDSNFSFLVPEHGQKSIDSLLIQYKQTDWHFAQLLASRLNTVVVPSCLNDNPYIAIGMPARSVTKDIAVISFEVIKDIDTFLDLTSNGVSNFTESDAVGYLVKSRDIFDLCDPIGFQGSTLYVYSILSELTGAELIHHYMLKPKGAFRTKKSFNKILTGASLSGIVRDVQNNQVQIEIDGDIPQSKYMWFEYETVFSTPDGAGWYFMPKKGDQARLAFSTDDEKSAYVASSWHIPHDRRLDPDTKHIWNVEGQRISMGPVELEMTDGAGSTLVLNRKTGISMNTDKTVNIEADGDINISSNGKVDVSGRKGVFVQQGISYIAVGKEKIEIASNNNKVN